MCPTIGAESLVMAALALKLCTLGPSEALTLRMLKWGKVGPAVDTELRPGRRDGGTDARVLHVLTPPSAPYSEKQVPAAIDCVRLKSDHDDMAGRLVTAAIRTDQAC